ncbi:hypothetical protein CHARACLAT_001370 [Characodon lateralis]|uniref:Uncharacterized protein n=1 Tax=Characodon lateralis TaxID=208331 RepID=A0ABU7EQ94_9TELE|nr:hypothetical protein [Characodon lateralis]
MIRTAQVSCGEKWLAPPDGPPDEPGRRSQETAVPKNRSAASEGAPPTALPVPQTQISRCQKLPSLTGPGCDDSP